ncbi:MAG: hypothetical protein JW909_04625 [Planctomycetes bacterium]|nr:hypothetical protein [Planctomycetota bacterium]
MRIVSLFALLFAPAVFAAESVIVDFETAADMEALSVEEADWVSLSLDDTHPLSGTKSLKAVFIKHPWPGFHVGIGETPADWSRYAAVSFKVWAPSPVTVHVRIDDVNSTDHATRFGASQQVKAGETLFQVRMKEIATVLDTTKIQRLIVFLTDPPEGTVLWFDDFRLGSFNEALLYRDVPPPGKRLDIVYSNKVVTPHFKWASPLPGEPPSVFLLPNRIGGRDVVELAQRMDMTPRTVTIDRNWGTDTWGFGNFYGKRGHKHNFNTVYSYLAADLGGDTPFDVSIVQFPHGWDYMPAYARDGIARRVENGEGLVLVKPYFNEREEIDERLLDISPLVEGPEWYMDRVSGYMRSEDGTPRPAAAAWVKTTVGRIHPVTRSIDLSPVNPLDIPVHTYEAADDALVLIQTEDGRPVLAVRENGNGGRVAAFAFENRSLTPAYGIPLTASPQTPYRYQDYYYGLLARTALWCAHRLDDTGIECNVSSDGKWAVAVSVDRLPPGTAALEVSVEDASGAEKILHAMSPAEKLYEYLNGAAPFSGVYRFRALDDGGRVLDFAWLDVPPPAGKQPSLSITPGAMEIAPGKELAWKVSALNLPAGIKPLVHVELRDTHGRLLAEARSALDGSGAASGTFPTDRTLTRCLRLKAEVPGNGGVCVQSESAPVLVTGWKVPRDDYRVIQWPNETHPFLRDLERRMMHQWGSDGLFSYENDPAEVMLKNISDNFELFEFGINRYTFQYNPFSDIFARQKQAWDQTGDKKYLVRQPCLSDPATFRQSKENTERRVLARRKYGIAGYSLGEESSLTSYRAEIDFCHGTHCLNEFRTAMRRRYSDNLSLLNLHWRTAHRSWDEVVPMTLEEAREHGVPAPWLLHRLFMDEVWATHIDYCRLTIHQHDPSAVVGTTGTQEPTPFDGHNWPVMMTAYDFLMPYTYADQQEYHVSFGAEGFFSMPPAGYGNSGDGVRYSTWRSVFYRGMGHVMFWWIALVEADLTWSDSGADYMRQFREFRSGIVKQISASDRKFDRVALLYSQPSLNAEFFHKRFEEFKKAREAWLLLLHDAGMNPRFITLDSHLPAVPADVDVLVLYRATALSDAALQALDAFVARGGVILYDVPFGTCDEAGIPRKGDGTTALPGASLRCVKNVTEYPDLRKKPSVAAGIITEIIGMIPPSSRAVSISTADGSPAIGVQAFSYVPGPDALIVGLLRERSATEASVGTDGVITYTQVGPPAGPMAVTVRPNLPAGSRYLAHDMRGGGLMSKRRLSSVDIALPEADAAVIAFLPYTVRGIVMRVPHTVSAGTDLRIPLGLAAVPRPRGKYAHVVNVTVEKNSGPGRWLPAPHYSANIETYDFKADFTIPFALDDSGSWRITVRDVLSGAEAARTVTVK